MERLGSRLCLREQPMNVHDLKREKVPLSLGRHPLEDQVQVLQEDRQKLLLMQPMQPWFTQDQKKELAEVHPWIHQHTVPQEINTQCCVSSTMEPGEELNLQTDSPNPPTPDSSCPQDCASQDARPNTDT